jgi:FtsP/CotA-like multicopper oxidase with cupredoxin domain
MLSRRALLAGGASSLAAPAILARAQSSKDTDRVHTLNLTGEMAGYVWSINNVAWDKDTPPLAVAEGELVFRQPDADASSMHLHGHEFQVADIDGERFPGRGARHDPGDAWTTRGRRIRRQQSRLVALQCHLLYHLEAGRFATVKYV